MVTLTRRGALAVLAAPVILKGVTRARAAGDSIRLAYQTGDINVLLMYVVEKGLFEKRGVSVQLLPFPAGPQQLPALASGDVDMAWMGEFPAVSSFANGLPLEILLIERLDTGHQRLVVNPETGIKDVAGLKGRTLGVSLGSTSHFLSMLAFTKAGMHPSEVKLVNLSPDNMAPAYVAKRIDAIFATEPNISKIEAAGGLPLASPASLGTFTANVFVARKAFRETNEAVLQKFLAAWEEGLSAYHSRPRDVLPYEAKRLNMSVDEMQSLIERQKSFRPTFRDELEAKYMGKPGSTGSSEYADHLKEIATFLYEQKKIASASVEWSNLINSGPLDAYLKGRS